MFSIVQELLYDDGVMQVCARATFSQPASITAASAGFLCFRNDF